MALEDVTDPVPGPCDVLVEIRAVAANFVDTLVVSGTYQFLPALPFSPGKLPTGVVLAAGPGVSDLRVGDRVLTLAEHGGYAQKIAVPANACHRLPENLSFVDAASMALAYDTAWFSLCERGRAKSGETVLVLGATGGVGLAAVQLAKAYGLRTIAGVSSMARADAALAAGADAILDLSVPHLKDSIRDQVYSINGGEGVDIVLDPLGGDVFDGAIRAMAWRGRYVVIGFAAGRIPTMKINYVMLKNIEVSGVQVSDYRKRVPSEMSHCLAEIFRLYSEGKLRPGVSITYPLARAAEALRLVAERRAPSRLILLPNS